MQEYLGSNYSEQNYFGLLGELLRDIKQVPSNWEQASASFQHKIIQYRVYGEYSDVDSKKIGIISVQIKDRSDARTLQRQFLNNLLSKGALSQYDALIAAFFDESSEKWKLSFITIEYKLQDNRITQEFLSSKRYTFSLGYGEKVKTYSNQLDQVRTKTLKGKISLNDLKDAFSVDRLTKDFYESVASLFKTLLDNRNAKGLLKINGVSSSNSAYQEFSVRLVGRLLFIWFLKVKKSSSGLTLIPEMILSSRAVSNSNDYYHEILEPLFFENLNKPLESRNNLFRNNVFSTIPYLNGGLFRPHLGPAGDHYKEVNSVSIPNSWFFDLLTIFESYNFTVIENDSSDIDVSVDPEMLGRIFENLLAIVNPDNGMSNQEITGSFYTPKHIVSYMSEQSISKFLFRNLNISENLIAEIFGDDSTISISQNQTRDIFELLKNIKIIDPACGSGAFPIGILQTMQMLMNKLDPNGELWLEIYGNDLEIIMNTSINSLLEKHNIKFLQKFFIISRNIYGIDIQPMATEISRLRSFLTLIIEETVNDDISKNRGVSPLPNLEFKFITANSLIDLPKNEFLQNNDLISQIINIREEYFSATFEERTILKVKFNKLKELLAEESKALGSGFSEYQRQLSNWDPFSELPIEWFDSELCFGVKDFDIVIQNPPYISTRDIKSNEKELLKEKYGFIDDLYSHFYYRGFELLKEGGIQTVISSDTYFTILTKAHLRDEFLKHTMSKLVFLGHNVFSSAMVSTAILISIKNIKFSENDKVEIIDAKSVDNIVNGTKYIAIQSLFEKAINKAFFIPNQRNMQIHNALSEIYNTLNNKYGGFIESSTKIAKFKNFLNEYRESLKINDFTLIGLVTDGGQGLATANNGKFVGIKDSSSMVESIKLKRIQKLREFNKENNKNYSMPEDEQEIWNLFDQIKEEYGRDIFGQGFLFRIVSEDFLADVEKLTEDEKLNGIIGLKSYVPYDKGDKDGNRWYLDNPYVIDWSTASVQQLKENSQKRGVGSSRFQNSQFYFREGFCYSDVNTHYIKARIKPISVHDVLSMSLFTKTNLIPSYYLITLLNSSLVADIVDNFINNTSHFQINDCRSLLIPVISEFDLISLKRYFEESVYIQKEYFKGNIEDNDRKEKLNTIQIQIDNLVEKIYGIS